MGKLFIALVSCVEQESLLFLCVLRVKSCTTSEDCKGSSSERSLFAVMTPNQMWSNVTRADWLWTLLFISTGSVCWFHFHLGGWVDAFRKSWGRAMHDNKDRWRTGREGSKINFIATFIYIRWCSLVPSAVFSTPCNDFREHLVDNQAIYVRWLFAWEWDEQKVLKQIATFTWRWWKFINQLSFCAFEEWKFASSLKFITTPARAFRYWNEVALDPI